MTKSDIIAILKSSIKDEWVVFKDSSDKKYFLDLLKERDLETFFDSISVTTYTENINIIEDMQEEFEGL